MATVVIKKPRHQATKFVLNSAYFLTSESAGKSSTHEDNHRQNTCTGSPILRKFNQPPAFGTPFVSHPAYAVVLCAWRNCANRRAGGAGYCLTRRQHSRWTERPLKSHHRHFQYGNWFFDSLLLNSDTSFNTGVGAGTLLLSTANIQPMDKSSETLYQLKPVTFKFNSDWKGSTQYGLIAEEVADVNPQLVVRKDGETVTVRYEQ